MQETKINSLSPAVMCVGISKLFNLLSPGTRSLNQRLLQVVIGDDVKVVVEEQDQSSFEVLSERQVRSLFGGGYSYDEEGKQRAHPIRLWFQWPQRRRYLSSCALPRAPRLLENGKCFNLWQQSGKDVRSSAQTNTLISSYFEKEETKKDQESRQS